MIDFLLLTPKIRRLGCIKIIIT